MSDYELVTPSSFCEQNWSDSNDILDEIIKERKKTKKMGILIKTFLIVKSGEYSDISDFDDSDKMLVKASQDAETNTAKSVEQKTHS